MESDSHRVHVGGTTAGCLWSMGTALVTAFMLFINGSFVLALVSVLIKTEVPVIGNDRLAQFLLFTVPVGMVVVEWWMLDYVRNRISFTKNRRQEEAT